MGAADPGAHPWLGRLAPDLDLVADGRRTRLSALVAGRRPLLLAFNGADLPLPERAEAAGAAVVRAQCGDPQGAEAALLRPDGHTAWVRARGGRATGDLEDALARWCGTAGGRLTAPVAGPVPGGR